MEKSISLISALAIVGLSFAPPAQQMEQEKKETDQIAEATYQQVSNFLELLFANGDPFSKEILSEEEKDKTFDADLAAKQTDQQSFPSQETKIKDMVKTEELEGTEKFLIDSQAIIDSYKEGVGVVYEEDLNPQEKTLETCQEGGSSIRVIEQRKVVTLIPEKIRTVHTCLGHKEEEAFYWISDAKKKVDEWTRELSRDCSIESRRVFYDGGNGIFSRYQVFKKWTHTENTKCNNHTTETKIIQERKESDRWETDSAEEPLLKALETNIECTLLQTNPFNPETRTIAGEEIYRDSWNQRLIFSCNPNKESKCQRLRDLGGVLLTRTCLEKDTANECINWEKTYALPDNSPSITKTVPFKEEEFFDPNDFETPSEKNTELPQVIGTLASIKNVGASVEKEFDPEKEAIFCGTSAKCRRSFNSNNLFDCCHAKDFEGQGGFIKTSLGACSKEERELFEKAKEGKCHYIGRIKNFLMTRHVYCCYPTKLARIVQEEAHTQLGLSWGTAKEPQCRGLSMHQIQSLDFEAMDFAEYIEEIQEKIAPEQLTQKLKSMAQDAIQSLSKDKAEENTKKSIERK